MKEKDLFSDFVEGLVARNKRISFKVIKRYLKIKYGILFDDDVLIDRLLNAENFIDTYDNKKSND